ncbi:MAG: hypothetical protein KC656_19870, partial [Myxococcales bacterium]|nr:hypothetical protein [Myxococcales bacterium]
EQHFYPRVPNAQLHPLVRFFLQLGNERLLARYCHLHPEVDEASVRGVFSEAPKFFQWAGADLFHVTDPRGRRRFVVIETNSSPSGQKSMPLLDPYAEQGGYRTLLERTFLPMLRRRALPRGELAVLWDKNWMEVSGYAAVLADLTDEPVHLVHVPDAEDTSIRFDDGVLHIRDSDDQWIPIRAAFRYVTQRPWTRIPPVSRTAMVNPVVACLAGGRNKSLASIAYDLYNAELTGTGLAVRVPETIPNVSLPELPLHIDRMGGVAMVKVPYGNAGQGVDPIVCRADLDALMHKAHAYERFLVQGLIGNTGWSSITREGRLFHVGTLPTKRGQMFVSDLRFMVGAGPDGFYPLALYSRRAPAPLARRLQDTEHTAWEMLGTNLSKRQDDGSFTTEPERLMLMDSRDFNHLGIGLDDLVEAYVQTVLATHAIDRMAQRLITQKGRFRRRLFASLVSDASLMKEICE